MGVNAHCTLRRCDMRRPQRYCGAETDGLAQPLNSPAAHLIKFLERMRGALTAAPMMVDPVINTPLRCAVTG